LVFRSVASGTPVLKPSPGVGTVVTGYLLPGQNIGAAEL
jgi:hypothetical protein